MPVVNVTLASTGPIELVAIVDYNNYPSENVSGVRVDLQLQHASAVGSSLTGSYLKVEGQTVTYNTYLNSTPEVTNYQLTGMSLNVPHNDAGEASLTISAAFVWNGYVWNGQNYTINTLSGSKTIQLDTIQLRPDRPLLYCDNDIKNNKYIANNAIKIRCSSVTDPLGGVVYYNYFGHYRENSSDSWATMGDSDFLISKRTSNTYDIPIGQYSEGAEFEIWIAASNSAGYMSAKNTIRDISKNISPNAPSNISPSTTQYWNEGTHTISWDNSTDPEGDTVTYTVYQSINNGTITTAAEKSSNNYYALDITKLEAGQKIKLKIYANDDYGMGGCSETPYYYRNGAPSKPTNIKPDSGEYTGTVRITWDACKDPEGRLSKYKIGITSDGKTSEYVSYTTYYDFTIPDSDSVGTEYKVYVDACDQDGASTRGEASGSFKKGLKELSEMPVFTSPTDKYISVPFYLEWTYSSDNAKYNLEILENGTKVKSVSVSEKKYYYDCTKLENNDTVSFRIQATMGDSVSGWQTSATFIKYIKPNKAPLIPEIIYPANGSNIYSSVPRIVIKTYSEPDGDTQYIYVSVNGITYNTIENQDMFSELPTANAKNFIFYCPELQDGINKLSVYSTDGELSSDKFTAVLNKLRTLEDIQANEVCISKKFMEDAISLINEIRSGYGLTEVEYFQDIIVDKTYVYSAFINTLKSGVNDITNLLNQYDTKNKKQILSLSKQDDLIAADIINIIFSKLKDL